MRAIFCGNLELDARQSEIERLFKRYGRVERVDMKTGFAFVYMEDERDAEDAIRKLDRVEFGRKGRRLRVEWTKQERDNRRGGGVKKPAANDRPSKTLFVINFDPVYTKSKDLERHFDPYGKIANIRIRRNFAFIQYETLEDAAKALEATNMSKLMDRVITVEFSIRDDDRSNGSPDRRGGDRDMSSQRGGYSRRRSPSPYQRERGSPDYGNRRDRGSPDYGRSRGSPDYGRGRGSPGYGHGRGGPEYERGRGSPEYERGRGSPEYERGKGTPEYERGKGSPDYVRGPKPSSKPEARGSLSPEYELGLKPSSKPDARGSLSPDYERGKGSPDYVRRSKPSSKPEPRISRSPDYEHGQISPDYVRGAKPSSKSESRGSRCPDYVREESPANGKYRSPSRSPPAQERSRS